MATIMRNLVATRKWNFTSTNVKHNNVDFANRKGIVLNLYGQR